MKYKAIIETDDYKDFEFYEDGNGKYMVGKDAGAVDSEWIPLYFTECEQEPILDKIRTEIEKEYLAEGHSGDYWNGIGRCLQIIDKYKAESEDKQC